MVGRTTARYVAPAALVAAVVGALVIVTTNVNSRSPSSKPAHVIELQSLVRNKYAHRRFYTVQAGDNLTGISTKTGIDIPQLEQLNPSLDPNSLQAGQRIRLRR